MDRSLAELDNEVGMLGFAFGCVGAAELSGRGLVRLLGHFGRSPSAARSLVARCRRAGVLESRRDGRDSWYQLAGTTARLYRTLERRGSGEVPDVPLPWDGSFETVLFSAPETRRAWRDLVRRRALAWGYRSLHAGVMIGPEDRREELLGDLPALPEDATLLLGRLALPQQDAASVASRLWALDEVGERLRACAHGIDALGPTPSRVGPEDFHRYVVALQPAFHLLAAAPSLPGELLPADWPMPELHRALRTVHQRWTPSIRRWCTDLVSDAGAGSARATG